MMPSQLTNVELVRRLEPWFPLFGRVGSAALRDHLDAIPILGLPRKTERANDLHRTIRNNFRPVCDLAEPWFELKEEPDGQGLDYLICRLVPEQPFTIRWGRVNGGMINRNRTERTKDVHEQGGLFGLELPASSDDPSDMPVVTLGYTMEDEYTEAGRACWWMGRLLLLRERFKAMELVTEVHVYSQPERRTDEHDDGLPQPRIVSREQELREWAGLVDDIRRRSA